MAPPVRGIQSPKGWVNLRDHTRVILSDFGVVIDIPEADPRPYVTLDAALLMHDRHMQTSRSAPAPACTRPTGRSSSPSQCAFSRCSMAPNLFSFTFRITTCCSPHRRGV
eukprot:scaffold18013_cov137-Isochrysis_galbana.AAC.4